MAKYTTLLKDVLAKEANHLDIPPTYNILSSSVFMQLSRDWLFDFSYSIPDVNKKSLEETIIRHYLFREIGLETVALFKLQFTAKVKELANYYSVLFKAANLEYNPLIDTDMLTESSDDQTFNQDDEESRYRSYNEKRSDQSSENSTSNGSSTTNGSDTGSNTNTSSNTHIDLFQDTPQGNLQMLNDQTYLTDARKITDSGEGSSTNKNSSEASSTLSNTNSSSANSSSNSEGSNSELNKNNRNSMQNREGIIKVKGKSGGKTYAAMIKEYMESIRDLNIEFTISLEELFMGVF